MALLALQAHRGHRETLGLKGQPELTEPRGHKGRRVIQALTPRYLGRRGMTALKALLDPKAHKAIRGRLVLPDHRDLKAIRVPMVLMVLQAQQVLMVLLDLKALKGTRDRQVLTDLMGQRGHRGLQVLTELMALKALPALLPFQQTQTTRQCLAVTV